RLKSGLTATLNIRTSEKEGVIIIPQYTLIENDEGTFVRRVDNGSTKDIPVTIGIRGQNGMVEIISGINEGDNLINIGTKINEQ
ncbi:hypothetical protein HY967_04760, partial [Candidatus Jorgensenbacteria bacterium]|nr:hypothetical protein [Candidatus Jorgensenbacteria bacterium]